MFSLSSSIHSISIHAPRTGSDSKADHLQEWRLHFNPRSPHGERRRHSERRRGGAEISIHAPRTGSDPWYRQLRMQSHHFNPRSPHGERPHW